MTHRFDANARHHLRDTLERHMEVIIRSEQKAEEAENESGNPQ